MCGIIYIQRFDGKPVNNDVLDQFDKQRSRGVEGFGLFDGKHIVRATTEDKILNWMVTKDSSLMLFHHRYPTSTENTKGTAHPFATKKHFGDTEYILVHNGHIQNSWKLKADHEAKGVQYQSVLQNGKFNDSEALLWDLSLYLEGQQDKLEAIGNMAFICIKLVKGRLQKMYFGRNTNPLNLMRVKKGIMLSSTGLGKPIDANHLYTWNYKLNRLTDKWLQMQASYPVTTSPVTYTGQKYLAPKATGYAWEKWDDEDGGRWETISDEEFDEKYNLPLAEDEKQEAQSMMLRYLMGQKGNFDIAYCEMEYDYQQILEDQEGYDDYRAIRIIEAAMELLCKDPEYMEGNEVSTLYRQLTLA